MAESGGEKWGSADRLAFLRLLGVIVAWGLWYQSPSRSWVVAIACVPLLSLLFCGKRLPRPFVADFLLLLFLATAGVGVWASYDPTGARAVFAAPVGWQKLWGVALACAFFWAISTLESGVQLRAAVCLLTGLGVLVAFWYAATNDWSAQPTDWPSIARLGRAMQAKFPSLSGHQLNANVAAGLLVPLWPLALGLLGTSSSNRIAGRIRFAWGLAALLAMSLGLLLTMSRGGLLAIGGSCALVALYWVARRLGRKRWVFFVTLVVFAVAASLILASYISIIRERLLANQAVANRFAIFSQAMLLVRDYVFTGGGLGSFALVHSTYALLIHVPILPHAHSFLLNVALEQGLPGSLLGVAFLSIVAWLGLRAMTREQKCRDPLLAAGLLSLLAFALHGIMDDPIYSSRGIVLLWVPAAVVVAASGIRWERMEGICQAKVARVACAILGAGLGLLVAFGGRTLLAAWYANLGAVAQTRTELAAYNYKHFDNPSLDHIRQSHDLSAAVSYFGRALSLSHAQPTALTRLVHIALARSEYEQALAHAEAAWEAGYRDRVTRLLFSDALVAAGDPAQAAELVRGLVWAKDRLAGQAWYRYWLNQDYRRAAAAWKAVLILDPTDGNAQLRLAEAERRVLYSK